MLKKIILKKIIQYHDHFDLKVIHGFVWSNCIWIKFTKLPFAFAIQKPPLVFSKKYGSLRFIPLLRGWQLSFLVVAR